jgi:hypothetical protein
MFQALQRTILQNPLSLHTQFLNVEEKTGGIPQGRQIPLV